MTAGYQLPGRADGVDGLLTLADHLGPATVYNLIRTCRLAQGPGADPGGDTMTILAHRVIAAETKKAGGDEKEGFKNAAKRLGYPDWYTRANFDRVRKREVGSDGDPELLRLADIHGDAAVYDLIRLARTRTAGPAPTSSGPQPNRRQLSAHYDAGRQALTLLAQQMVAETGGNSAREDVGVALGYTLKGQGNSIANFYKILAGGRAPETRPRDR